MNNFNEKFTIKKNKLNARLDKLNNYVEKLNNYIRENNDKIINIENKLDNANNEYNNLYKSKKVGLFKRLKNIEDNLVEVDNNDNKVGIFKIIKDIKDRGIKIDNDDEAVREIREHIKELIDDGVKVNNFDEMAKEIIDHVKKLKEQGADVKVDENRIIDLINKIYEKNERNTYIESEIYKCFENYGDKNIFVSYDENKNKFNTEEITKSIKKLHNKLINFSKFNEEYNKFVDNIVKFEYYKSKKRPGSVSSNQKKMIRHATDLENIVDLYNPKLDSGTSKKGE